MPLPKQWAKPEDFATLFQYFWHRDFPIDQKKSVGAKRIDWTIHIGIVVRNIADFMGLVTRFERGGRKEPSVVASTTRNRQWQRSGTQLRALGNPLAVAIAISAVRYKS